MATRCAYSDTAKVKGIAIKMDTSKFSPKNWKDKEVNNTSAPKNKKVFI